jgi:hypothetical protein
VKRLSTSDALVTNQQNPRSAKKRRTSQHQQPTMFKKPKSKPKALKKRTTADADAEHHQDQEGGSEDHDAGAAVGEATAVTTAGVAGVVSEEAAAVRAVKRRRHVLTGLQYKRGVDAARLLARGGGMGGGSDDRRSGQRHEADHEDDDNTNKPRGDEPSLLPSNTKMTNESQVWKERHEKAMEDFIQSKIREQETQQVVPADAADQHDDGDGDASTAKTTTAMVVTSKDELFRQLAETAKQLSGKNEDESLSEQQRQHQEVLRSGAATAMAEVILPSSSSSSAAAAFTARRGPMTTTMRPRGGMHAKEGTAAATATAATADGRVGFAAARGIKEIKPREQSADEKAYKNFVQRQRR